MKSSVFLSDLLKAHEPTRIPLTRPSAFALQASADESDTLSPIGGEGRGEGARFIGRHLLMLAASSVLVASTAGAADFGDIQFWAGSGTNQAAFVVDWNDGQSAESLIWGYRWDGSATGTDMFRAIVGADSRFLAHLSTPGAFGVSVYGIGYDLDGDNVFGVSPSLTFDGGGLAVDNSPDDSRVVTDGGDHWLEGWNTGFWGYSLKTSSSSAWESAATGPSDRQLSDGVWDGYSFAPGFAFTDPSEPSIAPVPEPGSMVLVVSGGLFLLCARRKLW